MHRPGALFASLCILSDYRLASIANGGGANFSRDASREEKHFIQRKDSDWLHLGDVPTVGLSLGLVSMGESPSQHTSEGTCSRECWKGEVPSAQIQIGTEASEAPSIAQYFRILVNQQCTRLGSFPAPCFALCMSDLAFV